MLFLVSFYAMFSLWDALIPVWYFSYGDNSLSEIEISENFVFIVSQVNQVQICIIIL